MTVFLGMAVPGLAALLAMSVCWRISLRRDTWYDQRFEEIAAQWDWYE